MSLDHRGGNGQPMMDREEHKHVGDNENQPAGKGVISFDYYAMKIVESGDLTYICTAAPGTALATAKWQCKLIDESTAGTTLITWADGNLNFDNVATDPTGLTYS